MAALTTLESGVAAPAVMVASAAQTSMRENSRPSTITQPSKPSSATSTFEPLPMRTHSTSWAVRTSTTRAMADGVWHTASMAAGPPIR